MFKLFQIRVVKLNIFISSLWIPLRQHVLDTVLCDKACQWHAAGGWFSLSTPVSSTNNTDHHDITEILFTILMRTQLGEYCLYFNEWLYKYSLRCTQDITLVLVVVLWYIMIFFWPWYLFREIFKPHVKTHRTLKKKGGLITFTVSH